VEKGGWGETIKQSRTRKIYTYLGNVNITDDSNAFIPGLTSPITPAMLAFRGDTTGRDNVINFIHGLDAYDGKASWSSGRDYKCEKELDSWGLYPFSTRCGSL